MTRRWTLGAVSLLIAGCLNPPPPAQTPGAPPASQAVATPAAQTPGVPPASQEVASPGAAGAETTPNANGVKLLSLLTAATHKLSGADPAFPAELRASGRTDVVSAKICVSNVGAVDSVLILAASAPALATSVLNAVKDWRYTPLTLNGGTIPFCYVTKFLFRAL